MARLSILAFILLTTLLSSLVSNSEATRPFWVVKDTKSISSSTSTSQDIASREDYSLLLNALPKGKVPFSAPSKKGHSQTTYQNLVARRLVVVDRNLRSVPSPGMGH